MPTIARRPVGVVGAEHDLLVGVRGARVRAEDGPGHGAGRLVGSGPRVDLGVDRPARVTYEPVGCAGAVGVAACRPAARARTPPTCGSTSRSPRSPTTSASRLEQYATRAPAARPPAPTGWSPSTARRSPACSACRRARCPADEEPRGVRPRGRGRCCTSARCSPGCGPGWRWASSATGCPTRCCTRSSRRPRWPAPTPTTPAGASAEAGLACCASSPPPGRCRCRGSCRSPRPTGCRPRHRRRRPAVVLPDPDVGGPAPGRPGAAHAADRTWATSTGVDELEELGRWLEEFHARSWLELDYAGLARLLGARGGRRGHLGGRRRRLGGRPGGRRRGGRGAHLPQRRRTAGPAVAALEHAN